MAENSKVVERFLKYVKIDTQSDEAAETFPSTDKQRMLAKTLVSELEGMGAENVYYDNDKCYVYASIPATADKVDSKVLGFIAHMDTSPEVSGCNVKPQIVKNYDGKALKLGIDTKTGREYILDPKDFPELSDYVGKDIITTDGTTLLGADDKAGVAEIMTMAEILLSNSDISHGRIAIAFTPDEEVGAGVDFFDIEKFGADYAYTVDGGAIGELEYENFNAALAIIEVTGRSVHPGDAKNKMKNAILMAMEFEGKLPAKEKPQFTEKYEGFYHLESMEGSVEYTKLSYIIRDHDKDNFESKKEMMNQLVIELNEKYGEDTFNVIIKDQYYNMKEKIEPAMFLIDNASACMKELGIEPKIQPIRGGTDGARLSFMGIPCPNLCTGGHNYHGRYEYCCIQSMETIVELLVNLTSMQVGHKRRVRYKGTHPTKFNEKYKELNPEKYGDTIQHVISKGSTPAGMHISIMVKEILDFLQIQPGQKGFDATLGYGGHSKAMMECLKGEGHLYSLDIDPIESVKTKSRLEAQGFGEDILTIIHTNFRNIDEVAREYGPFNFAMADLGVSSMQIDNPERGFSYKLDGPLDLRLNPEKGESAAQRLLDISQEELEGMLVENSDEPYAKEISRRVMSELRKGHKIDTTTALRQIIEDSLPNMPEKERVEAVKKSCQRTFQALRIDVNSEFEVLEEFLYKLPDTLEAGGRVAILTFHSGEDRLVKRAFKEGLKSGIYREVAKDVIRPSAEECNINGRARSTKMRWAVKA